MYVESVTDVSQPLQDVNWEDYKNLRLEALKNEPQAFGSSYTDQVKNSDEIWQQNLKRYAEANECWMVFVSDGERLVGMAGAFQTEKDKTKQSAQTIAVYLKKEFRGKGVGSFMINALMTVLKEHQLQNTYLSVNKD